MVRCIGLMIAMARAKRGIQLRPFYDQRGWSWRGAYRDIGTLRDAGIPVLKRERGWFSLDEAWIPPAALDLAADELEALAVARQVAPALESTPFGHALARLWSKLSSPTRQATLPFRPRDSWLVTRELGSIDYAAHRPVFEALRDAIGGRHAVTIGYRKPDGSESVRTIEPQLVHWEPTTEAFYVIAWCRLRGAVRTFAIHRIVAAQVLREPAVARAGVVVEIRNAFRLWARPTAQRVAIRFTATVAGEIRERRWHPSQRVIDLPDGEVVLELEVGAPEELERFVLGFGPDAEVLEPPSLAARVRERHLAAVSDARMGALRAGPNRGAASTGTRTRASRAAR